MTTLKPKPMDIELYLAAASPLPQSSPDNGINDTIATAFRDLLASRSISNHDILSYKSPTGSTLLHVASLKENLNIVKVILSCVGYSITSPNSKGDTVLYLAARSEHMAVVNTLVHRREKDIGLSRVKNLRGNTAAHEAIMGGHCQTMEVLVGCDPRVSMILNNEDKPVLYIAVKA